MIKLGNHIKKKESLVVLVLIGLILLVIAIPTKKESGSDENVTQIEEVQTQQDYCELLESRLEEILSCIEGVGKVQVMITLKDSGESIVEKDSMGEEMSTETEESHSWSEETVYGESGDETIPYVINTYKPQIQGVLIVAQGGNDPIVQNQIMQGVMALFGLESHKISIINME